MHIVLGALTTIVTILWLLHRLAEMGIDLGGLNPWYWRRRRAWRKKYEGDPIYAVEDPIDVAAIFVIGADRDSNCGGIDQRRYCGRGRIGITTQQARLGEHARQVCREQQTRLELFHESPANRR